MIFHSKVSYESDVWSFGVTLWEIFSFAMVPYTGMSNSEVVAFLKDGNVMKVPSNCPETIEKLMLECWNMDPLKRPLFKTIVETLNSGEDTQTQGSIPVGNSFNAYAQSPASLTPSNSNVELQAVYVQ